MARKVGNSIGIGAGDGAQNIGDNIDIGFADNTAHGIGLEFAIAVRECLFHNAECIAHTAAGEAGYGGDGGFFIIALFGAQDFGELFGDLCAFQRAQRKAQTAGHDGGGHFLRVGGGEDKFNIIGGFFQRFEHGGKGGFAEHVDFVNNKNFAFAL